MCLEHLRLATVTVGGSEVWRRGIHFPVVGPEVAIAKLAWRPSLAIVRVAPPARGQNALSVGAKLTGSGSPRIIVRCTRSESGRST